MISFTRSSARRLLWLLLALLAAAGLALGWLVGTASGLSAAAASLAALSGGKIVLNAPEGRLLGPLRLARLEVKTSGFALSAEGVDLRWTPPALFAGRLQIDALHVDKIRYLPAENGEREAPPHEITLPVALRAPAIAIGVFEYGTILAVSEIEGALTSDRRRHTIDLRQIKSGATHVRGSASVDGAAPITLAANAELTTALGEKPLALTLAAAGPLAAIALRVDARAGAKGYAEALVTPFADAPFASAHIALDEVDPAAWASGAPAARIEIRADLVPGAGGVGSLKGELSLINRVPGALDKKRLPINALTTRVDWQERVARFNDLRIRLAQNGELVGRGEWRDAALDLELSGRAINAAGLHTALIATRLQGAINARVSANAQSLRLKLADARFRIEAEAAREADSVTLKRIELVSAKSRLSAQARLAVNGAMAFQAQGELANFDPARFAKLPAAQINARFAANGALQPRLRAQASFTLDESRVAGQPFSGQGEVDVDWPLLPKVDVAIKAGENRLTARGAFGRGNGVLTIDLAAPTLSPYGLEGGIAGRIELAGSLDAPTLSAQLSAERIGLPGHLRLSGLALSVQAGAALAAPLQVELTLARADTPERAGLIRALRVHGDGTTRAQRWQAQAALGGVADARQLSLAAAGGLQSALSAATPALWRGQLTQLALTAAAATPLQLTAPAPLVIAADAWTIGPAELAGAAPDWRATLHAAADRRALTAKLDASGERIGRIELDASAGMLGAWSLNEAAPWQARLKTQIPDLAWVARLIDASWQSAGRLDGELTLAGTPARPLANGHFRGKELVLRRPEQGLALERGELDADLANNLLRVRRLAFDSVLQPMPAPLRRASGDAVRALAAKPGHFEVAGELELDASEGASTAFVDFQLDRVGAWQLPEQWLLVSGSGRLAWRAGALSARGAIKADAGYWQLAPAGAPRLSDDVIVKRAGAAKTTSGLRPKLDLDLTGALGDSLHFSGAGLTSRLGGEIRLRAQGRDLPRASGTISTREGRYEAYGQQLSIERGTLTFQGLPDNPALDIRAVRKGLPVEAGVQVSGNAQRPIVRLVSDPELPDSEKLAWLVLGHGSEQMGAGDAATLLSAASGVLGSNSGGVIAQIRKRFGVDELGVRQGQIGDTGRQATSRVATSGVDTPVAGGNQIFIAGKRIAENAVLSYEQVLGKAESIVKLTIALSRRVSLVGRAGSDNAIDLFYTITLGEKPRPPDPLAAPVAPPAADAGRR